jgi:hypothetical protein
MNKYGIDPNNRIESYVIAADGTIQDVKYRFDIEKEVVDSVRFCSEVMAEMYNMPIDQCEILLWDSPHPKLLRKDPVAYGHFSFEDWSQETYKYHKRLGNI